ncbi:MAG TPA: Arc family DNA-binding protein [Terriglobia bacterium]|nr:Arc family DNA-binding protein [Terriglobia bacterium]
MPNLTVREIPKDIYKRLKESARRNHRSLNAEIVAILNDEDGWIRRRREIAAVLPDLDQAREEFARKYGELSESVHLIREDRDSR